MMRMTKFNVSYLTITLNGLALKRTNIDIICMYICSDRALRLYISDIGVGRWVIIIRKTVCRQWFGRAWVLWAVSWVSMSDSRLYRWRPPEVTQGSQSVMRS